MEKTYLTQTELAERWGFTASTLAYWRKKGIGPKFARRGMRQIIYYINEVVAYENENPALAVNFK